MGSGILNQIAAIAASALGAYLTGMAVLGRGQDKILVLLAVLASLILARAVMYYFRDVVCPLCGLWRTGGFPGSAL